MKRFLSIALIFITLLSSMCFFTGCSETKEYITSFDQLNNSERTIYVNPGSSASIDAEREFPNAKKAYSYLESDGYLAVREGRADAFMYGKQNMQYAIDTRYSDLMILEGKFLGKSQIAVGINPKKPELQASINSFITLLKTEKVNESSNETILQNMEKRWVFDGYETMPSIEKPTSPTKTLHVGTAGFVKPMTYDNGNGLIGLDIEFCERLALYMNVKIEFHIANFDELILGLKTNNYDIVVSNLNITEERKESILFSNPYIETETGVLVKRQPQKVEVYDSLDQIKDKKVGFLEGSAYIDVFTNRYPQCEQKITNSFADLISALKSNRIDAYVIDYPIAKTQLKKVDGLKIIPETITKDNYAFMLNKSNSGLCSQINQFIKQYKEDGTLDKLKNKWIESNEKQTMSLEQNWEKPNGILKVHLAPDSPPFAYLSDNKYVGYDVELMFMIAEKLGYGLDIKTTGFASLVTDVEANACDIVIGCITVTEERKESVLFTDVVYESGSVAVVLSGEETSGFFDNLVASFERTFIREQRWKMIANGLLTTLELAVFTLIIGTVLGFGFSFLLRSKNKVVSKIAKAISIIIDGLPILIILMVLYYIVFAKTSLSAITIGIIGLSLDFANAVAGIINTGIIAVDKGQIEVATSMGYSKWKIFLKIVLPQVINQMFTQYTGAIIAMIKGTSIIGYITVIDLTKASDIIRSTTYDAFFPLIASALIYFIIARIFVSLLQLLAKKVNPKHRKRIIKGVKIDD